VPIRVIEADVEKDISLFLNMLNRNRTVRVEQNRFEWLYLDNPQGKARAWIVVDEKTDTAVAFTSVLPRMVKVDGKEILCWNCCDFSVDKKFRTLGVAVKLRRMAKEGVDNGEIEALYAHPNDRMKLIHDRVGHPCIGKMNRYVKVLRGDRYLKKVARSRLLLSLANPIVNFFLKVKDLSVTIDKHYTSETLVDKPYDSEYDRLFEQASEAYKIIGDRRSAYLNWRYIRNPLYRTERIIIRDNGKLAGYVIFYIEDGIAVLKDILCTADDKAMSTLMGSWIKLLRRRGVDSISIGIMDKNPLISKLKKIGFRQRTDGSSVYAYAGEDTDIGSLWTNGSNWYMTVGDRDV